MAAIKKTPTKSVEPVEVEETVALTELEEMRAELKRLRDEMNAKPTHIPETPEVDKYAEKNFEAIALRTKADLEEAKVNVIFPGPTQSIRQHVDSSGMVYQYPKVIIGSSNDLCRFKTGFRTKNWIFSPF